MDLAKHVWRVQGGEHGDDGDGGDGNCDGGDGDGEGDDGDGDVGDDGDDDEGSVCFLLWADQRQGRGWEVVATSHSPMASTMM